MAKAHKVMIDESMLKGLVRLLFRGKKTCSCGEMLAAHEWILLNGNKEIIGCSFKP